MSFTDTLWAALLPRRDALLKRGVRRALILQRLELALVYLSRRMIRGEGWRV